MARRVDSKVMANKKMVLFLQLLSVAACRPAAGISDGAAERAALTSRLRAHEAVLQQTQETLLQAKKAGFGAAYYLSYSLEEQGELDEALNYTVSELGQESPVRYIAALRAAALLEAGAKTSADLYKKISQLVKDKGQDAAKAPARLALAKLDFERKRYKEALAGAQAIKLEDAGRWGLRQEKEALEALCQASLGAPESERLLNALFLNQSPSKQTVDFFNDLEETPQAAALSAYTLYEGMKLAGESRYGSSYAALSRAIQAQTLADAPQFAERFAVIAGRAGRRREAYAVLKGIERQTPALARYHVLLALGRLQQGLGDYKTSLSYFEQAAAAAADDKQLDQALLAGLEASYRQSPELFLSALPQSAARWRDSYYYNSFLDRVLNDWTASRRFDLINRAYSQGLEEHASQAARAKYAWILSRAWKHNLLSGANAQNEAVYGSWLAAAADSSFSYASFMAWAAMGRAPAFLEELKKERVELPVLGGRANAKAALKQDAAYPALAEYAKRAAGWKTVDADLHMLGFLYYGLDALAAKNILAQADSLSANALRLAAGYLSQRGRYLEAMRVLGKARARADFKLQKSDYYVLYPRVFEEDLAQTAAQAGLDLDVLYGLVRQESGFARDVVSHAGAVGLAQIMPGTAREHSAKLGMAGYDLTDPSDNLRLGGAYINWMQRNLDSMYGVLLGYNGGPTRVRRWRRQWQDLPPELFVEAVPYRETRNYVKQILTGACVYAVLYGQRNPLEVIKAIYPDLEAW